MTISFDASTGNAEEFGKIITGMGYKAVRVLESQNDRSGRATPIPKAVVPADAPDFFRVAFEGARKLNRPIVIDFWATWCGPCKRLKRETLADTEVAVWLKKVALITVDVDKHPSLAKAYGVVSVPDVFLVGGDGSVVDRLRNFEPPDAFRARLERLIGHQQNAHEVELLAGSLKALRERFNAGRGRYRFVALLSPT